MDMKVDSQKLIQLRNARAWSQQHLADVSGLSLRTIQRIEKTQSASHDSIGALASVFETTPDALLMGETHATTSHAQGQPTSQTSTAGENAAAHHSIKLQGDRPTSLNPQHVLWITLALAISL
ncbi:MAG: helix-turn-helix transcriptional regulator, partial [Pseudomonadota bacterium]|nr:helix-turn-helix transcriptional regulator [Pseudomonadota bacterium]